MESDSREGFGEAVKCSHALQQYGIEVVDVVPVELGKVVGVIECGWALVS
jgi:hypothetical protein